MSRVSNRQVIGSALCFWIGTRFPESPIPSRVLIAIGPGAPPRGQLQGRRYCTRRVLRKLGATKVGDTGMTLERVDSCGCMATLVVACFAQAYPRTSDNVR